MHVMKKMNISDKDLELINTKQGKYRLLKNKEVDLEAVISDVKYEHVLQQGQVELIKLQNWVIQKQKKVVILFEGRDAAGKGGAIRRITERINPRHFRIVALNIPTEDEQQQWFFQRYVNELPKPGEIVFFDRSWYNRAVVEPVNGFCTEKQYKVFMTQVNDFERMLVQSDTYLIKFYFSIDKKEQAKRFKEIKDNPLKRWKITPVDKRAQELWDEYTKYKERMFEKTNTKIAPWTIIDANKKSDARLEAVQHMLDVLPYEK